MKDTKPTARSTTNGVSPLVRTTFFIPTGLRKRLKERAYELSEPDQVPVSMGAVIRTILTDALSEEEAHGRD